MRDKFEKQKKSKAARARHRVAGRNANLTGGGSGNLIGSGNRNLIGGGDENLKVAAARSRMRTDFFKKIRCKRQQRPPCSNNCKRQLQDGTSMSRKTILNSGFVFFVSYGKNPPSLNSLRFATGISTCGGGILSFH
ncbi:hypothetical protein MmiHf6_04980 [Methanimicrococcus hongohii]|uniref:Uncharacterized protein n=1 Tax=Methanimicrococcus hongohii TaxID=3028295 RepID=A0AA96V1B4_9EURY|nr:hypothetical protein MmiHf6_04980 [Methanimicrococcus sp. Hf6]